MYFSYWHGHMQQGRDKLTSWMWMGKPPSARGSSSEVYFSYRHGHVSTGESQEDIMDALPFDWGWHAVWYDGSESLAAGRVWTRIFIREEA